MSQFDVFENRWEISGTIILETPLHIGAGEKYVSLTGKRGAILKRDDQPLIPGSSFKGILRSSIERLLRTFNSRDFCQSVDENLKDDSCCGKCIICQIFGSQDGGGSITVRDSFLNSQWLRNCDKTKNIIAEQPHCATQYDNDLNPKMNEGGNVDAKLWLHERVVKGAEFDFSVSLDNADENQIGLILLALDEFNNRRAYIGSKTSRGLGVISINPFPPKITHVILGDFGSLTTKTIPIEDAKRIIAKTKEFIHTQTLSPPQAPTGQSDFSTYERAFDTTHLSPPSGCVVTELKIELLENFRMKGAGEALVTSGGIPYIPGSTIKGFLRHTFINKKNSSHNVVKEWIFRVFGALNAENKPVHWSHLLVSDAFPDEVHTFPHKTLAEIPKGTLLSMWMIFNNMESNDIKTIMDVLTAQEGITITGKTSAESAMPIEHLNKIKVSLKDPPGFRVFRAESFLK